MSDDDLWRLSRANATRSSGSCRTVSAFANGFSSDPLADSLARSATAAARAEPSCGWAPVAATQVLDTSPSARARRGRSGTADHTGHSRARSDMLDSAVRAEDLHRGPYAMRNPGGRGGGVTRKRV